MTVIDSQLWASSSGLSIIRVFGTTTQSAPEELLFCTPDEAKKLGWKLVRMWTHPFHPDRLIWDVQWVGRQETVVVPDEVVRQIRERQRKEQDYV